MQNDARAYNGSTVAIDNQAFDCSARGRFGGCSGNIFPAFEQKNIKDTTISIKFYWSFYPLFNSCRRNN